MYVLLSQNSFVRVTERYGYIVNQLTHYDRVYDSFGAILLQELGRTTKSVESIVAHLLTIFTGVNKDELYSDFMEFVEELNREYFVILGENEDLAKDDYSFSYSLSGFEATDPVVLSEGGIFGDTQSFFMKEKQGRPMISSLQFELSSRCNERCIHCYIPNQKKDTGSEMPTEKVMAIIDEFAELGGLHVTLSGGEAFLNKDVVKIARYARSKDLMVTILSNLIAINDSQIEELSSLNLALVQTSLYSMNPETHDYITKRRGSFARTKKAIEKLVKANIPVQISCPIMKANVGDYSDVVNYAKSLKVSIHTDYIMMAQADCDTSNLVNRLSLEETEKLLREQMNSGHFGLDHFLVEKAISEKNQASEDFPNQPLCGVGYDNCCITANGDVYPCAGWQDMVLGNINKLRLKDIWENSDVIKRLRNVKQSSFPKCLKCEAQDYCSRCLVRNYNESHGDMFAISEHFCKVAFLTKKLVEERMNSSITGRQSQP